MDVLFSPLLWVYFVFIFLIRAWLARCYLLPLLASAAALRRLHRRRCGVTDHGMVLTWGMGTFGRLGHGGQTSEPEPRAVAALQCTGEAVVAVSAGSSHSGAVTEGGSLFLWGGAAP